MSEEKVEEETYSLIFASLKHPIRRKILRMLADKPLAFSEILDALSIDSGHLSYHLENLGDLVTHPVEGKYALSSIGTAAVKLMGGVEEHPTPPRPSLSKAVLSVITKASIVAVILALIASSIFYMGFVASARGGSYGILGIAITILPNQTFTYNITVVYKEKGPWTDISDDSFLYMERPSPINTITEWEEGSFGFSFNFSEEYDTRMRTYDSTGAIMKEWWHSGGGRAKVGVEGGSIIKSGTYRVEIKNLGSEKIGGTIGVTVEWRLYTKPYYYHGIAGLIIASIYPALVLVKWILTKIPS